MKERCLFCDAPAAFLCDAPLAKVWTGRYEKPKGRPAYRISTMEDMLAHSSTCDAAFCARHGKLHGFIRHHGTIDYCIGCHQRGIETTPLLTPDQIDAKRQALHDHYRSTRVSLLGLSDVEREHMTELERAAQRPNRSATVGEIIGWQAGENGVIQPIIHWHVDVKALVTGSQLYLAPQYEDG